MRTTAQASAPMWHESKANPDPCRVAFYQLKVSISAASAALKSKAPSFLMIPCDRSLTQLRCYSSTTLNIAVWDWKKYEALWRFFERDQHRPVLELGNPASACCPPWNCKFPHNATFNETLLGSSVGKSCSWTGKSSSAGTANWEFFIGHKSIAS